MRKTEERHVADQSGLESNSAALAAAVAEHKQHFYVKF